MFDEIQILRDEEGKRIYGVILDRAEVRKAMRGDGLGGKNETRNEDVLGEKEQYEDEEISGQIVKISISHDGEYATAVCLAAEETNEML
jgi:holo-[acyl-carrier protein] synthase